MRGWSACFVIVFALAVAGCLGAPQPVAGPGDAAPDDAGAATRIVDLHDIDYKDALHRFELHAVTDIELSAEWDIRLGSAQQEDDCAIGSFLVPHTRGGGLASDAFVLGAWAWQNSGQTTVTLQGEGVEVVPHLWGESVSPVSVGFQETRNYTVPAGERVIIEVGGKSPGFPAGEHTTTGADVQPNAFRVALTYVGEAEWVEAGTSHLRCGVGTKAAEDAVLGVHSLPEILQGGRIPFATEVASTLFVQPTVGALHGDYMVEFLGDVHPGSPSLVLSRDAPGEIAIVFEEWVSAFPTSPAWLMADVHWPWLNA